MQTDHKGEGQVSKEDQLEEQLAAVHVDFAANTDLLGSSKARRRAWPERRGLFPSKQAGAARADLRATGAHQKAPALHDQLQSEVPAFVHRLKQSYADVSRPTAVGLTRQIHSETSPLHAVAGAPFSLAREISAEYNRINSKDFAVKEADPETLEIRPVCDRVVPGPEPGWPPRNEEIANQGEAADGAAPAQ